jgi:hypothetical protein
MPFLFRYKKNGIPFGLIRFHDLLLKDTVEYFEKGKLIRKRGKEARRAIKRALKIAKKNKRNPAEKIARAIGVLRGFGEELEITRKALRTTYNNIESALNQIEEERIDEPFTLIENARQLFIKNDFKKGIKLLEDSKEKFGKKVLSKTRKAFLGGISSEVRKLKAEIERSRKKKAPA